MGTVVVAILWFLFCCSTFTPESMGGPIGRYLITDSNDEYAYLTHEALSLAQNRIDANAITIFGASTIREAVSSPKEMEEELRALTGQDIDVNLLVSGALSPYEVLVLLDTVRHTLKGVVVMDISPLKFRSSQTSLQWTARNPRLAIQSEAADSAVADAGFTLPDRSGNYFIDNYRFFVARPLAIANIFRPIPVVKQHMTETWGELNEMQWRLAAERMAAWESVYLENREWIFAMYSRAIRLAKNSGLQVALLESTRNPKIDAMHPETEQNRQAWRMYRSDVLAFATREHVPYWNLADAAELTENDFADQNHLRNRDARRRFTRELALRIADMLPEEKT